MFKKDDIVVCIVNEYFYTKEGDIYKLSYDESPRNTVTGKGNDIGSSFTSKHVRLATEQEIIAYNKGIRNINDIKDLSYEIY